MASVSHPERREAPERPAAAIAVVIETPRGGRNKYKFDKQTGRLKLSKVMPEGMVFPFDFGFIPDTKSPDGDPLDVLLLHDEPTFPGCQIDCRLVGVFKAREFRDGRESENDRILAVAAASIQFGKVHELSDLEPTLLRQLEEFFVNYKKAREIRFEITAREGAKAAYALFASHQESR
jgi:inorganic pyrophosphatase